MPGAKPRLTAAPVTNGVEYAEGFGSPTLSGVVTRFAASRPSDWSPGLAVTIATPPPKSPAATATGFDPVLNVCTSKGRATVASVGGVLVKTGGRFGGAAWTVSVNAPSAVAPNGSVTRTMTVCVPMSVVPGVTEMRPLTPSMTVPFGAASSRYVSACASTSAPSAVTAKVRPTSAVAAGRGASVGAWFSPASTCKS